METFGERTNTDYRTPFQVDRDRILHSAAFRRLQSKTQVFHPGEYDFYRTRLTHTIEVSQIGRSITRYLLSKGKPLRHDFYIDEHLVEAICLAHDLGHGPFGHAGEAVLNDLMSRYGGFEGNAQTLRLLTETIYPDSNGRSGMCPTRALLDGVLKYKKTRSQKNKKKFIYDEQQKYLDFAFPRYRPIKPQWESIECQIMNWADDIAYSVGDVVDGAKARFITPDKLRKCQDKPVVKELNYPRL